MWKFHTTWHVCSRGIRFPPQQNCSELLEEKCTHPRHWTTWQWTCAECCNLLQPVCSQYWSIANHLIVTAASTQEARGGELDCEMMRHPTVGTVQKMQKKNGMKKYQEFFFNRKSGSSNISKCLPKKRVRRNTGNTSIISHQLVSQWKG